MVEEQHKRRKFFVRAGLQTRFTLYIVFFFIVAAFMVWWEMYYGINTVLTQLDIDAAAASALINKIIFVKVIIGIGLITLIGLVLSHYVAGPIFRLEKTMRAVSDGNLKIKLSFRKLDELKGIEASFNTMLASINSTMDKREALLAQVRSDTSIVIKALREKNLHEYAEQLQKTVNKIDAGVQ